MSKFLHNDAVNDNDADDDYYTKAIAIPLVFSENCRANKGNLCDLEIQIKHLGSVKLTS